MRFMDCVSILAHVLVSILADFSCYKFLSCCVYVMSGHVIVQFLKFIRTENNKFKIIFRNL